MGSNKTNLKDIFSLLLLISCLVACTYERRSQQYSLAIRADTAERASIVREAVKSFARSNGFQKETTAGNEEYLEKNGNFVLSFIAKDESYISLNNVSQKSCYSIGVYSAQGKSVAENVGQRLLRSLKEQNLISGEKDHC